MRSRVLAAAVFLLVSAVALDVAAAPNFEARPTAIYLEGGTGAPVGLLGLGVERTLAPLLAMSAGVGRTLAGTQLTLMPRALISIGRPRLAVAIGAGVSFGPFRGSYSCLMDCSPSTWAGTVLWGDAEVAFEYRREDGLFWRGFFGAALVLDGQLTCVETSCDVPEAQVRRQAYGGFALGYAF